MSRAAEYAAKVAQREHDNALESLQRLRREVVRTLEAAEEGRVSPSVGGSHLNRQTWDDAERALVRWTLAADVAAVGADR